MKSNVKTERVIAAIIDSIILGVISYFIMTVAGIILAITLGDEWGMLIAGPLSFFFVQDSTDNTIIVIFAYTTITAIFHFIYYVLFPVLTKGATLGKLLVKIKVVDLSGKNASFRQLLFRSVIFWLSFFPVPLTIMLAYSKSQYVFLYISLSIATYVIYIIVLFSILANNEGQAFYDRWFGVKTIFTGYDEKAEMKTVQALNKDWLIVEDLVDETDPQQASFQPNNQTNEDDEWTF